VEIVGNDEDGAKNIYVLYCPSDRVDVTIKNFRLSTDAISLAHLSETGYYYPTVNDIPFALNRGPLTLLFCSQNKLQVILSSHTLFDLQEKNVISVSLTKNSSNQSQSNSILIYFDMGVVGVIVLIVVLIFSIISYLNREQKKELTADNAKQQTAMKTTETDEENNRQKPFLTKEEGEEAVDSKYQSNSSRTVLPENLSQKNDDHNESLSNKSSTSSYYSSVSASTSSKVSPVKYSDIIPENLSQKNNDINKSLSSHSSIYSYSSISASSFIHYEVSPVSVPHAMDLKDEVKIISNGGSYSREISSSNLKQLQSDESVLNVISNISLPPQQSNDHSDSSSSISIPSVSSQSVNSNPVHFNNFGSPQVNNGNNNDNSINPNLVNKNTDHNDVPPDSSNQSESEEENENDLVSDDSEDSEHETNSSTSFQSVM
jgi:uncharacterized membrane protein